MKKNICYFVNSLVNGGVEAVLYNYLSRMDLSDSKIIFITNFPNNEKCCKKFEELGANIYEAPSKRKIVSYIRYVSKILKKENINIIHTHLGLNNFLPSFIGWINRVPVRISHSHVYKKGKKSISEKIRSWLNNKFSNYYMACGKKAGEYMYGSKKGFYLLKNAIDIEKYLYNEKIRKSKRKELNLVDKNIYLNIGRFSKQKNQLFLIDIFKEIIKSDKKAHLIMVGGDGELYDSIMNRISEYKLNQSITILKNRNDVNEIYQAADVFLLPSLLEGFPLVSLEAQSSTLPMILSSEITKEAKINDNVYYLPIDDAKKWASQALSCIKSGSRKKIENKMIKSKYNIDLSYLDLENKYTKLLSSKINK